MNIRSLTRGDGVVIGAAVLLFIASFLNFYSMSCTGECGDGTNAWESKIFPVLPSIFLAGLIAAALIVVGRALGDRKFSGLDLGQLGTGIALSGAWAALWMLFDSALRGPSYGGTVVIGIGHILGFIALLVISGVAVAGAKIPALQAKLLPDTPAGGPSPYGVNPNPGYGYPGAQQQAQPGQGYGYPGGQQLPQPGQPQPGQPYGQQPADATAGGPQGAAAPAGAAPAGAAPAGATPAAGASADFAPFWFAVPVARPLYGEDGSPAPIAELAPGTWYLAVEQRGQALIAQTQDGRRGVLQDTTGIQRG
ncbi:hypothetical protein [Streptomyces sp. NPDC053427]|uniref:hypothetical protein n=1 Tax=Streptomyces sp. NPDC053427 TaxID=3365701 RepID=UPI0037D43FB0